MAEWVWPDGELLVWYHELLVYVSAMKMVMVIRVRITSRGHVVMCDPAVMVVMVMGDDGGG